MTKLTNIFLKSIETTQQQQIYSDACVTGVLCCYIDVMLLFAVVRAKLADKHR